MRARTILLTVAAGAVFAAESVAQEQLAVTVRDSASSLPVPEAVARLLRARRLERADRLGRIRFGPAARPDTLVVAGVGFRPETLLVERNVGEIEVLLSRRQITLADLTVVGEAGSDLAPAAAGRWSLNRDLLAAVPPAIESDPLRALVAVPGVSFSSPLSARPVVRGYDAAESVVRLDGFELVNPYHIGRVFAAFPLDFTQSVDVAVTPHRVTDGETLAGVVDLVGVASGTPQQPNGGVDLSAASGTAWQGWSGPFRGFAGARVASLKRVTDALGEELPYDFRDGYARLRLPWPGGRWTDLTFYGSNDDLWYHRRHDVTWSNLLAGQRTRLVDRTGWGLDLVASFNRFSFGGTDLDARFSSINVRTRFKRWNVGAEARGRVAAVEWHAGAGAGQRWTDNRLSVVWGDDFEPLSKQARLVEFGGFASVRVGVGPATVTAGGRVDGSPHAVAWQPRIRLSVPIGGRVAAAASYSRAARLFHLITDPQPEPTLAFYDFWLNAGDSGVAVPVVHHVSAELDVTGPWAALHLAGYLSRGHALAELRPTVDQRDTSAFRFGDSRTAGLEVRLALRPRSQRGASAVLSYALAWSERRWDDGVWRPWLLDQRHRVRLQGEILLAPRWRASALVEARSAQPVTRVAELFYRSFPPASGDTASTTFRLVQYLYAPEGSARGSGTLWADLGTSVWFGGPGRSRITLGLSVTNVVFGPVAPLEPLSPNELAGLGGVYTPGGVRYERRFRLPAVPSLTARVEF